MIFFILIFLQLVLKLFLVIEKEELVLQNFAAAHLHISFLLITVSNTSQVLAILLNLSLTLSTLFLQMLTHFTQVILQQLLIIKLASDGNSLTKANHVRWAILRRSNSVPWAEELLLRVLWVRVRHMEIAIVG